MQDLPIHGFLSHRSFGFVFLLRSSVTHLFLVIINHYPYHCNYWYHRYYSFFSLSNLYFHFSFCPHKLSLSFHFYFSSYIFTLTFSFFSLHSYFPLNWHFLICSSSLIFSSSSSSFSFFSCPHNSHSISFPRLRLSSFRSNSTLFSSLPSFPNSFIIMFILSLFHFLIFPVSYLKKKLPTLYTVSLHKFLISSLSLLPHSSSNAPCPLFIPLPTRLPVPCTRSHRPYVDRKFYRTFNGHGESGNHYPSLSCFPSQHFHALSSFARQGSLQYCLL